MSVWNIIGCFIIIVLAPAVLLALIFSWAIIRSILDGMFK